jgi:processing peptidase subunit beta
MLLLTRIPLRHRSTLSPGLHILTPGTDLAALSKSASFEQDILPEGLRTARPCNLTELANGIKVVTEPSLSPLANVTLTVETGSRWDDTKRAGIGYMFARLCSLRLDGSPAARLETLGAQLSVQHHREITQFHMQVPKESLGKAFPLLAALVLPGVKYTQGTVETLKNSLIETISRPTDPQEILLDAIHASAFRAHPLGNPLKGTRKTLQGLTAVDIARHIETYIVGSRLIVSSTGAVSHDIMTSMAKETLNTLKKINPDLSTADPPTFVGSQTFVKNTEMDRVYVGMVFKGPAIGDPDYSILEVLKMLMSPGQDRYAPIGGVNFLQKWLGDIEDVIAHEVVWTAYQEVGLFGHIVSCWDLGAHMAPIATIKACVAAAGEASEADLSRARNQLYRRLLETTDSVRAAELGSQALHWGRVLSQAESAARADLVDKKALERACHRWFRSCEVAIAFLGPTFPERDYALYRSLTAVK